jgi:hypothetical protein
MFMCFGNQSIKFGVNMETLFSYKYLKKYSHIKTVQFDVKEVSTLYDLNFLTKIHSLAY